MFATHYFETRVLNTFRGTTLVGIGNLYCALFMSNPTDTGTAGIEVSYSGYIRLPFTFTNPSEQDGNIAVYNVENLLWEPAPSDVGQVRYIGIYDSPTAGNMLLYGELTLPLEIRANQQPSIYANDILYYAEGDFSKDFKTRILNVLRNQALIGFTPYFALFSNNPKDGGVELSGGSYERAIITFSAPAIIASGASQIQNTNLVRFPSPTTAWGLWAFDGIMDAETAGNLVLYSQNPTPETIQKNYVPQANPGDLKIAFN